MWLIIMLAVFGGLSLLSLLIDALFSPLQLIVAYIKPIIFLTKVQTLSEKFGEWAVITGGTDGIGKQYAHQLAKRGLNVVIISRNMEKLNAVAGEIEKLYNVKTRVVIADFSRGVEVYPHIEEEIRDITVGILVNNVGVLYDYPMRSGELSRAKIWEIINVNMGAATCLTHFVLDSMVGRRRGVIVNISSGSEICPVPLLSIYGASKAYIQSFTNALRYEYESKGICVQLVSPMFVATKMVNFSQSLTRENIFVPDAETFVKHAISTLGRVDKTSGYWSHGIQTLLLKSLPTCLQIKVVEQIAIYLRRDYFRGLQSNYEK